MPGWRILEHTADLRVEFSAADFPELLVVSGRAMFELLVEGPLPSASGPEREIVLEGTEDLDLALRNWLAELLYYHETEHVVFPEIRARWEPSGVWRGFVRPAPCGGLTFAREIKAVTWHGLLVEETPDGLRAEVLFDL